MKKTALPFALLCAAAIYNIWCIGKELAAYFGQPEKSALLYLIFWTVLSVLTVGALVFSAAVTLTGTAKLFPYAATAYGASYLLLCVFTASYSVIVTSGMLEIESLILILAENIFLLVVCAAFCVTLSLRSFGIPASPLPFRISCAVFVLFRVVTTVLTVAELCRQLGATDHLQEVLKSSLFANIGSCVVNVAVAAAFFMAEMYFSEKRDNA